MTRILHAATGDSAAGSLKQALRADLGQVLAFRDPLSCGPLQPFRSIDEWVGMRSQYWNSIAPDEEGPGFFAYQMQETIRSLHDADTIRVWLGVGAADQLFLAWLVQLLDHLESRARLELVQFDKEKTWGPVWSLGLLDAERIADHPPVQPLSAGARSELERCWVAATSNRPADLLALLSEEATILPHWRSAVAEMMRRYPDRKTGLGRWDEALLSSAKHKGPRAARVIGDVMGWNIGADMIGDAVLFSRLRKMGDERLPHPLVELSGDRYTMRECEVRLTAAGESMLAGKANAVALNGIDDWILGVHLDAAQGQVWYRDEKGITR